jgi:hypothetical protein
VPRRRLDGEANRFQPSNELANVLSHLGESSRSAGCGRSMVGSGSLSVRAETSRVPRRGPEPRFRGEEICGAPITRAFAMGRLDAEPTTLGLNVQGRMLAATCTKLKHPAGSQDRDCNELRDVACAGDEPVLSGTPRRASAFRARGRERVATLLRACRELATRVGPGGGQHLCDKWSRAGVQNSLRARLSHTGERRSSPPFAGPSVVTPLRVGAFFRCRSCGAESAFRP